MIHADTPSVPVLAAPMLDPDAGRREVVVPAGLTLAEILPIAVPGLPERERESARITLVTDQGAEVIDASRWSVVRPRPGVRVVIRIVPRGNAIRSILMVAVAVAAIVAAPYLAPYLASAAGISTATATTLVSLGLTLVGTMLVNALIPVQQPEVPQLEAAGKTYSISGFRNRARPGRPLPMVFGRHRYAPPFAATSYTEIFGDEQYIRALFCFGYGRVDLSDLRIGDTPITEYDDVDVEIREGVDEDLSVTLYPRQVLEEPINVELVRPLPRDGSGEIISGEPSIETPVIRWTAADTSVVSVILGFQSGLFRVSSSSGRVLAHEVSVRIRQRPEAGGEWQDVATLEMSGRKREAIFRQHTWALPTRGRWQIEITRMSDENTDNQVSDRVTLAGLQSIRPEYPVAMHKPVSLVAMRIRASYQINGALDSVNAVVQRYAPVYNGVDWTDGLTRNPASAFLAALQGPANPYPVSATEIDWETLADWHDWCETKGLKYDRVHDDPEPFLDMLVSICGAGRASPRHDGLKWGVVIDRPQTLVVDHISPRNAADFSWSRTYFEPPHAFRVPFLDETNGWAQAERLVPWPGHSGDITLTENLDLPGKTDPDEVWIEARRRQHEMDYRADRFSATQDGAVRAATRGDKVMASFDVLDRTMTAGRVVAVEGRLVELDEAVEPEVGEAHAIRFRVYAGPEDTVGASVVSRVEVIPAADGASRLLRVLGAAQLPSVGDMVHFGVAGTDSLALRVRSVEAGESLSAVMTFVADAEEIDALTDAEEPPAWTGRVGAAVTAEAIAPAAPLIAHIEADGDKWTVWTITVLVMPGAGSTALLSSFVLQHRVMGASAWIESTAPIANGGGPLAGSYNRGQVLEIRARAVAADGTEGAWTAAISYTVGQDAPPVPAELDDDAIGVSGGLGAVTVSVATDESSDADRVQLYLAPSGDSLDRDIHAVGALIDTPAGSTINVTRGDGTRSNLLQAPDFSSAAPWAADAGWTVGSGVATHAAGATDTIRQSLVLSDGGVYRYAVTVSGRTAGAVTPMLFTGSPQSGAALSANGQTLGTLTAATGNDAFGFSGDADFDGDLDDAVLYLQTALCLPSGTYDAYLEPQTLEGVPGPVSGPFSVTVI